jgi:hypothetical protein
MLIFKLRLPHPKSLSESERDFDAEHHAPLRIGEGPEVRSTQFFKLPVRRLTILFIISLFAGGCGALGRRPTPEPIYVTATLAPDTETPTPGDTPVLGPTPEVTSTSVAFAVPTGTETRPPSRTPSLTPSFTPTYTDTPFKTQKAAAPVRCTTTAEGGFGAIFGGDAALQRSIGCPQGSAVAITSASQSFENGRMLWASQLGDVATKVIYVLYNNGAYQRFTDTWIEGVDPESTGETAPAGRLTPVRGFGKVWHNNAAVKNGLGFATGPEAGTGAQIQRFERGEMLFVAGLGQTFIFAGSTWRATSTPF